MENKKKILERIGQTDYFFILPEPVYDLVLDLYKKTERFGLMARFLIIYQDLPENLKKMILLKTSPRQDQGDMPKYVDYMVDHLEEVN